MRERIYYGAGRIGNDDKRKGKGVRVRKGFFRLDILRSSRFAVRALRHGEK